MKWKFKGDPKCKTCGGDGYLEYMCGSCSGSGEGMAEGTTCRSCKGNGELQYPCADCFSDPTDDDEVDE
jgi:hypothetical protein